MDKTQPPTFGLVRATAVQPKRRKNTPEDGADVNNIHNTPMGPIMQHHAVVQGGALEEPVEGSFGAVTIERLSAAL